MINLHCYINKCRGCQKCGPEIPLHEKISKTIERIGIELRSDFEPIKTEKISAAAIARERNLLEAPRKKTPEQKRKQKAYAKKWRAENMEYLAQKTKEWRDRKRAARNAEAWKSPHLAMGVDLRVGQNQVGAG